MTLCTIYTYLCSRLTLTLVEEVEETDCLRRKEIASKRWETIDARASNTEHLLQIKRSLYYEWSNEKGTTFQRGKALIFYDENHKEYANELQLTFNFLDYKTKLYTIKNISTVIGYINLKSQITLTKYARFVAENKRMKRTFSWDGSFVLCVLGTLKESWQGLIIEIGGKSMRLSKLVNQYIGSKCPQLIGKPKLFFFVDRGMKTDGNNANKVYIIK